MRKVLIFGNSGSGKSTLAKKISGSESLSHLDLDTFFVSVERILDPSLKGKPVIVGGDPKYGRGVVAACSYEAREYGLHSAMPIRTAYRLCPHGVYIHGNHSDYSYFSKAVKNILKQYAPVIETASIDECYMDFSVFSEDRKCLILIGAHKCGIADDVGEHDSS